jgi:DNA replication protein DnaC
METQNLFNRTLETCMSAQRLQGNSSPAKSLPDAKLAVKQSGWRQKWIALDESNPKVQAMAREAEVFCAQFAVSPASGRMLVLYGPNGCGKTHTAKRIVSWATKVSPSIRFMTPRGISSPEARMRHWPSLLDQMKSGEWSATSGLADVELLAIDEIGGEHDPSKVGTDKLCRLLSARDRMWTVVTTNIHPDEWASVFDRRVASRLLRNSTVINLDGVPDYATI